MKPSFFLFFAAVCFSLLPRPSAATPIDLSVAGNYNTFIFKDFTAPSSDTEGRLAVGGNAKLANYSVGDKLSPSNDPVLVVGGDLTFKSGQVYHGDVMVGGSTDNVDQSVLWGLKNEGLELIEGDVGVLVNFGKEEAYLKALSKEISQLTATGTSEMKWGGMNLKGDGKSDLQVFNLNGGEVLGAHTFNLELSSIPEDAMLLFNINGKKAGLTNMSLAQLQSISDHVLFNFFDATKLKLSGIGVEGSILAPLANVKNPMGVINGTIIAKSWSGIMQQNHNPLAQDPGGTAAVPEPATLFLLGSGLIALAGFKKKRWWRRHQTIK